MNSISFLYVQQAPYLLLETQKIKFQLVQCFNKISNKKFAVWFQLAEATVLRRWKIEQSGQQCSGRRIREMVSLITSPLTTNKCSLCGHAQRIHYRYQRIVFMNPERKLFFESCAFCYYKFLKRKNTWVTNLYLVSAHDGWHDSRLAW